MAAFTSSPLEKIHWLSSKIFVLDLQSGAAQRCSALLRFSPRFIAVTSPLTGETKIWFRDGSCRSLNCTKLAFYLCSDFDNDLRENTCNNCREWLHNLRSFHLSLQLLGFTPFRLMSKPFMDHICHDRIKLLTLILLQKVNIFYALWQVNEIFRLFP